MQQLTSTELRRLSTDAFASDQRLEICISEFRHEPLDGGEQTQSERWQDRISLGRFQTRFCFSCWQWTATMTWRRDHHSQWSRAPPRRHHLIWPQQWSSACFYWLRQIRKIHRSLDTESAKALDTPSSHPVLIAAMPCWPGRQKPPLIIFSAC